MPRFLSIKKAHWDTTIPVFWQFLVTAMTTSRDAHGADGIDGWTCTASRSRPAVVACTPFPLDAQELLAALQARKLLALSFPGGHMLASQGACRSQQDGPAVGCTQAAALDCRPP